MENIEYDSRMLQRRVSNRLQCTMQKKKGKKNKTEMKKENGKVIHSAFLPFTYGILFLEYCVQYHLFILVDFKVLRSGSNELLPWLKLSASLIRSLVRVNICIGRLVNISVPYNR
jgi:hypothetical protein